MADELMFNQGAGERAPEEMTEGEDAQMGMEEEDRTDEYRANLDQMVAKIEDKFREANAMGFMADNEHRVDKEDTIRAILQIMAEMGVDLNDEDQIKAFIEKIKEQDPDLYDLFESTMNQVLNDDTSDEGPFGSQGNEGVLGEGIIPEDEENREPVPEMAPQEQFPNMSGLGQ